MKVIIVEVTRAANTFGLHTPVEDPRRLRGDRGDRQGAQRTASSGLRSRLSSRRSAFYGCVEQVLTGWIFDSVPVTDEELEQAKTLIVETICRGLEG